MMNLEPCPHCGGIPKLDDLRTIWRVECTDPTCGALVLGERAPEPESEKHESEIDWGRYERSAVEKWNRRANVRNGMMETVNDWLGRRVRIVNGPPENNGEEGVLLAVNDTRYQPAGWMKLDCYGADDQSYRSVDLYWLDDIETGQSGPTWGTGADKIGDDTRQKTPGQP